ncbi:hypothetical protein GGF31_001909 [Allomyces arbusculus]|nr:hypothetical protein GGF31_001909 [Allomyces arbusculus]
MMTSSNPIRAPGGTKDSTITGPVAASIFDAAFNGDLPTVQALFSESDGGKGTSILNKRDEDDRTPLHWACSGSRPEVAEWLLKHGSDANAADDSGWTPLIIAASVGSVPLVNLLVAHGADVNRQNETGQTALHYCASKNRIEVAAALLDANATPNVADQQGQLPIHRAASLGHLKLVQLLHAVGKSRVNSGDKRGNTPLHLACEDCQGPVVVYLIETARADVDRLNKDGKAALDVCGDKSFRAWVVRHVESVDLE